MWGSQSRSSGEAARRRFWRVVGALKIGVLIILVFSFLYMLADLGVLG